MGKTISVLLMVLLSIIIVVVVGNQQIAMADDIMPAARITIDVPSQGNSLAQKTDRSLSLISRLRFVSLQQDPGTISPPSQQPLSNRSITSLFLGDEQQPCWLRLIENNGPGLTLNRVSPNSKPGVPVNSRVPKHNRQPDLLRPATFSSNLLESSPPGYFLLI